MPVSWSKGQREAAKRDQLPLIFLAVDEWHLGRKRGKLELSGPADVRIGAVVREFITALCHSTDPIEECFAKALKKVDGERCSRCDGRGTVTGCEGCGALKEER